jgi:hypothetical protein
VVAQARGLRTSQTRRFPLPWSVERSDACFIIRDHGGQALAYVYFEEEPGRRARRLPMTRPGASPQTSSGLLQPGEGPLDTQHFGKKALSDKERVTVTAVTHHKQPARQSLLEAVRTVAGY